MTASKPGRLRLLLVEDDEGDAHLIRVLLRAQPEIAFDLQEAPFLAEGERRAREGGFDAALLDMTLPDSQGLDNVARLRAAAPGLPIVVLSGRNEAALAAATLRCGAQDYVVKGDLSGASLVQAIRHAIERKVLSESLEKWERIFLHSGSGAAVVSADGAVLQSVNLAYAKMHGCEVSELAGRPFTSTLSPESAAQAAAHFREAERQGHHVYEAVHHRKDGTAFPALIDLTAFKDESGAVRYHAAFCLDLTERKRFDELEALRRREAMLRDFIANISHEFRTPVAAIKGFTETLRLGAIEDKENRLEFVRIIERHAHRLSDLVEDLLRLSVMEAGGEKPRLEELSLEPFLMNFIKSIAPLAERKEIALTASCPPGLKVVADREQLEQVLQNLCRNAIEYNRPKGRVRVTARQGEAGVTVTVRDTGMGIGPEELPHLFERFYRGGEARRQKPEGTGLGLLLVKRIVEAHGGRIWAQSQPGKASILRFTLPSPPARH